MSWDWEILSKGFELVMKTLDNKKASILSIYNKSNRNILRELNSFNEIITELAKLNAPLYEL